MNFLEKNFSLWWEQEIYGHWHSCRASMKIGKSIRVHRYNVYLMLKNFMKNCTAALDVAKTGQKYEALLAKYTYLSERKLFGINSAVTDTHFTFFEIEEKEYYVRTCVSGNWKC